MRFVVFFCLVLTVAVTVWFFQRHGRIELATHASWLIKTWSVWLASMGSAMGALSASFPQVSLTVWQNLPPDIKSLLPPNVLSFIAAFLVAMAVIAQYIRQKNLARQIQVASAKPSENSGASQ